jgi:Transposase IS116/IS110/IS902 family
VLCQIRGVGRHIAMLVIAEVGDVTRFPTARHLCSRAGMTPTVRTSDQRTRLGHIPPQGSPAPRGALAGAAQHAARGGGPLRQAFERIAKRRGRQVAKVAVARKLLTPCFYGLRDGEIRRLAPRAGTRTLREDGGQLMIRPGAHVPNGPQARGQLGRARLLSMAPPHAPRPSRYPARPTTPGP